MRNKFDLFDMVLQMPEGVGGADGGTTTQAPESAVDTFSSIFAKLSQEDDAVNLVDPKKDETDDAGSKTDSAVDPKGDGGDNVGDRTSGAGDVDPNARTTDKGAGDDAGLPDPKEVAAQVAAKKAGEAAPKEAPKEEPKVAPKEEPKVAPKDADQHVTFEQLKELFTPKPEAKKEPQQPQAQYTEEERGLVDAYMKEFPEVARAEQLMRREENKALVGYIFGQIAPILTELVGYARSGNERQHMAEITTANPDYSDIHQQVVDWVGTQPPGLKAAYNAVLQQGTPEDVTGLLQLWRTATGYKPADTSTQATTSVKPAPVEKRVIDNLKPPAGKRTTPVESGIAKDDFTGAFKAFASLG